MLEMAIAITLLLAIIGPLMYLYSTGSLTTSAGHSTAMLACLAGQERLKNDLEQIAFPDQVDEDDQGTRPPSYKIEEPGPDEGSKISFWVPVTRAPGEPMQRRLKLVAVSYYLKPIAGTPGGYLIRREGTGPEHSVASVVLRRLWFRRLQPPAGTNAATAADFTPGSEATLPPDLMRVTLTAVAEAASEEKLDRNDARRVHEFTLSFLASLRESSLPYRIREPDAGDHYQFLVPTGTLP
ncbi:MAG: hypothetical protein HY303_14590 [Candidatus Wallbacteria bacterium]|nr:hypothetical protein [Candidatus Wallbacteria bacterium]